MINACEVMDRVRQECRSVPEIEGWRPCLVWIGPTGASGRPQIRVRNTDHDCRLVAWVCAYGDTTGGGNLSTACGNTLCCEPSHLLLDVGEGQMVGVHAGR